MAKRTKNALMNNNNNQIYKWQILSVCVLITQEVAKKHMSNHIYSESVCLREGFRPFRFTLASIFFT